jgi:hypothetical protein
MNASLGEAFMVEAVLPHILRTHKIAFTEVVVVVDTRAREGKLATVAQHDDWPRFCELIALLVSDGWPAKLVEVDYSPAVMRAVNDHWFGAQVAVRCSNGSAIYAYLYGLESCSGAARFHVDCDMLFFDRGPVSWITQGLSILAEQENVLFANPAMGPLGSSVEDHDFLAPPDSRTGLRISQRFSTRCFLYDAAKLDQVLLPMKPIRHDLLRRLKYRLQGRSTFRGLEEIIAANLTRSGFFRCDVEPAYGFCIHAWDKRVLLDPGVGQIISDVEAGVVPEAQRNRANLVSPW